MAEEGDKKKRKAKYISSSGKRNRSTSIPFGRQGFLVTCDGGREHQCARECIYLLDQYYDKLSEENGVKGKANEENAQKEEKAETKNFDELLEAEAAELRDKEKARFSHIETGCNGIVFISMTESAIGPIQLAESIIRTVATTKKSRTRFSMKLLPIEATCYPSAEEVKKAWETLVSRHFPSGDDKTGLKFRVEYEARANTGLDRKPLIDAVAGLVPKPHSVDLQEPQLTIIVQVVRTTFCIGVVSGYKEFKKYNLRQLVSHEEKKSTEKTKPANQKIVFEEEEEEEE